MDALKVRVTSPAGKAYDVIFLPLDPYLPGQAIDDDEAPGAPGRRWRAELHEDMSRLKWQFGNWPLACAWVYIPAHLLYDPDRGGELVTVDGRAQVRWIEVPEPLRRRGYATLLIAGLLDRWPDLWFREPYSDEMQGLLKTLPRGQWQ
jgi:hypothetical protein